MQRAFKRARIRLRDAIRFSRTVRLTGGAVRLIKDYLPGAAGAQANARRMHRLCGAARHAVGSPLLPMIESRLRRRTRSLDVGALDWNEFVAENTGAKALHMSKGAVIKPWVGPREKGVVFVSFEDQLAKLLLSTDLAAFAQRYSVVLAPGWFPPHCVFNLAFPKVFPAPIYTITSNTLDLKIFPNLSRKFVPIPLLASDWVNPALFRPRPRDQRDIDILMVANYAKYKRHHVLFDALRQMPAGLKVMLIGQGQDGRTSETILGEADAFGVADRLVVHGGKPYEFVADAFCRARISLILSRREGSCVAVTESMFGDTPVGLMENAEIGSRNYVNRSTGRLLRERGLARQLAEFLHEANTYEPRKWAEANISCHQSTKILNAHLREHARATGQGWTRDVATLCWRPDPRVLDEAAGPWLDQEVAAIRERFGIVIGPAAPAATAPAAPGAPQFGAPDGAAFASAT